MELPINYKEFIINELYSDSLNTEQITKLFNLYNHYVNPSQPEYGKSCFTCINKVVNAVKSAYPKDQL